MGDRAHDIPFTIGLEGGDRVTDYAWDPGGLTKYGICQRSHPNVDIRNLTLAGAEQIYADEYWGPAGCEAQPEPVALNLFDAAVNLGPGVAKQLLAVPRLAVPFPADAYLWARVARYADITERNARKATTVQAQRDEYAKFYGWLRRCLQVRAASVTPARTP